MYYCPVCKNQYASEILARACAATNEKAIARAGDIVIVDVGYGWFDGLEHWMVPNTGKSRDINTHSAYFIITSVDYGNRNQANYMLHTARYSMKTLGIINGTKTGLQGWNTARNHLGFKVVKNPDPRLIEEGRPFLGQVYERLL